MESPMSTSRLPRPVLAVAAAAAFALCSGAIASAPDVAKDEIDHLLGYVAASSCTFVRNGDEYPADKAREHLASKYRFAGGRIASADDFIGYLATKSSLSGEPYHVKCGKTEALAGAWLRAELERYRHRDRLQHAAR
jgi:hypothetical protein